MTRSRTTGRLSRLALSCQSDSRLVALVRDGSDRAFEEIVDRYRRRLVAYAGGIVAADRAEDVVQEALVRALLAIRRGDGEISLRAWLYTIVRNRALNHRRDEPAHERLDERFDGVPQPPEIADRREELASVVDRVKALPDAQRRALVQRELEGRSHDEIAASLAVTPGAARGLIFRARCALRDAAGLLVPMPLLRALAESSAVGDGGAGLAAAGGGGLAQLGTALTVAVVVVSSGAALHDNGGNDNEARADPAPPARSAHTRAAIPEIRRAAGPATAVGGGAGPDRRGRALEGDSGRSDSSGPGSEGSGPDRGGTGSSGPGGSGSGTSGSEGSGSDSSGSGSSGDGSSGDGGSLSSGPGPGPTAASDSETSGSDGGAGSDGGGSGSSGSGTGSGDGVSGDGGSSGGDVAVATSSGGSSGTPTTTATTTTTTTDGEGSGSSGGDEAIVSDASGSDGGSGGSGGG